MTSLSCGIGLPEGSLISKIIVRVHLWVMSFTISLLFSVKTNPFFGAIGAKSSSFMVYDL